MNLPDIQQQIRQLEDQRSRLHLPPLAQLEAEIVSLGARAAIDQRFKEPLRQAIEAKTVAEQQHELAADIDRQLKTLNSQREIAELDNRRAIVDNASADLAAAVADYDAAAKAAVRAYRRCLNIRLRNMNIPGAKTGIPKGPDIMHLRTDANGAFTLPEEMNFGLLRFEVREQEQLKAAA